MARKYQMWIFYGKPPNICLHFLHKLANLHFGRLKYKLPILSTISVKIETVIQIEVDSIYTVILFYE
jgi:hypothetical protein